MELHASCFVGRKRKKAELSIGWHTNKMHDVTHRKMHSNEICLNDVSNYGVNTLLLPKYEARST